MPSKLASFASFALAANAVAATSLKAPIDWQIKKRSTVTDPSTLADQTFDYVIVGGGTAGLVIASRLSENSSVTVAVIEAGSDGSDVPDDKILAPAQAYFAGIAQVDSEWDWGYETTAQSELNDREIFWPRGKVLGGSSASNGLYMIPQSALEQDSWASIAGDENWSWDSVYPYLKKSEIFTPPSDYHIQEASMIIDSSLHGGEKDIGVHRSYPGLFYNSTYEWIPTLANMGVDSRDPAGGEVWGAFIATSAINPSNWTRSYSKTGYLDPINYRSNLVVLSGYQATKIVFNDDKTATGVEFAQTAAGTVYTVSASQEVILSAGVMGSPQLLQVSGVGPADLLTSLGIDVVYDLPGVGAHLMDHLSGAITLNTSFPFSGDPITQNATYAAEQLQLWQEGDPNSLYNSPNDAVAYVNLTTLFGEEAAATFIEGLKANQSSAVSNYGTNAAVQQGYNATYQSDVELYGTSLAQAEILLSNTGTYGGYPDSVTVQIQAALQHPMSRGSLTINSTSTFDKAQIDPGYLTHPADVQVLREAFKFARKVSQTAPFSDYVISELSPGSSVSTDVEWETWLRGVVSTEYHPSSTCGQMPESLGGVVDTSLRVYGVSGVRVIDSSIVPVGFAAHMTAPLYGIAERAYDLLVSTPKAVGGTAVSSSSSSSSTSSPSSGSNGASKTSSGSASEATASSPSRNATNGAGHLTTSFAVVFAAISSFFFLY